MQNFDHTIIHENNGPLVHCECGRSYHNRLGVVKCHCGEVFAIESSKDSFETLLTYFDRLQQDRQDRASRRHAAMLANAKKEGRLISQNADGSFVARTRRAQAV